MLGKQLDWKYGIVCLLLIVSTITVYGQMKNHDFINFDDTSYITENMHIRQGLTPANIRWAFASVYVSNWHPLTWISHMMDVSLFGLNPGPHHLVNLLFHIMNSLLLFMVLNRMTHALWRSAMVAALFALHPLHVESVAWASERKDVLCGLFWMLTTGAYVLYIEKPNTIRYVTVIACFALGLMAKPMLVTLPFVFLLLDYWPLKRFPPGAEAVEERPATVKAKDGEQKKRKDPKKPLRNNPESGTVKASPTRWVFLLPLLKEKIPLLILSAVSCIITVYAQKDAAVVNLSALSVGDRIGNALVSYIKYLGKTVWPLDLSFFYPLADTTPLWQFLVAAVLLLVITVLIIRVGRRFPYLATGWLWFLGTLVPVIGLVQVGDQALADRYTYLTLTGLFIVMVWGFADLTKRWPLGGGIRIAMSVLMIVVLMIISFRQVSYWRNSINLSEHAIAVTGPNYLAQGMLGLYLAEQGEIDEAYPHFREALRLNPEFAKALHNFGLQLARHGRTDEAIARFQEALKIDPFFVEARFNLGFQLSKKGRTDEAIAQYKEGLKITPDSVAYDLLGSLLAKQGKTDEAIGDFEAAVRLNPDNMKAHFNLGVAFAQQRRLDEAMAQYREVLSLNPESADAHNNLGNLLVKVGRIDEGMTHFRILLRTNPNDIAAHGLLGD
ncbi:MAG: tetratricopeptide repeat protein, partial [Syntrophales bacterium]|nr:tetratricopeptide repeat protein [Syntrophales bacterium]